MKEVFTGTPTKEEIDLYLRQNRYSLLSMTGLRDEILSTNAGEVDEDFCKGFFQETFLEVKDGSLLREKTNSDESLRFFYESDGLKEKSRRMLPHKTRTSSRLKRKKKRAFKKLTIKNTRRNTGYKFVKLQYRNKGVFFVDEVQKKAEDGGGFRKVRWSFSPEQCLIPHNKDVANSILKNENKSVEKIRRKPRKKVKVTVETRILVPRFDVESSFKYKVNK